MPDTKSDTVLRFADTARRLGGAARSLDLKAPAFRAPPRVAGQTRTLRRFAGGVVVSVLLRDRDIEDVIVDMVDGTLAANELGTGPSPTRDLLLEAAVHGLQDVDRARLGLPERPPPPPAPEPKPTNEPEPF